MSRFMAHSDAPPQDGRASLSAQSGNGAIITPMRRFPPPRIVEEHNNARFIVKDATGQALAYFYFEEEPGRRSADVRFEATAVKGCVSSETARSRMDPLRTFPSRSQEL
jgi:hypothetical protein